MRNNRLLYFVEVAIFAALAFVFDFLGNIMSLSLWAQGGSISIAMVPIFLMAIRWGVKGGVVTGLLLGLLQIVSGTAYILTPVQGFLDYIVAFSAVGLAGILFSQIQTDNGKNRKRNMMFVVGGILLGSSLRFLAHFIAGVVFFGSGAADGQSVIVFSLLYNLSYLLPSVIVSGGVILLLSSSAPQLVLKKPAH